MEAGETGAVQVSVPWVVVNTQPHRERIAIENLVRQEFTAYCPMVRRRVKHARKVQDVLRPLFPSYVFVQVDQERQRWRPILSTMGVRTLVRFGEAFGTLDNGFIASLKAREVQGAIVKPEKPFSIGQQVKMAAGPFEGIVATIVEMDEKDRLVVLMDLLNQSVRVKVGSDGLVPC